MKNIGVISSIVVVSLLLIFYAYTRKWDREEIEREKAGIPKPEIKPNGSNNKFQALLFFIFIIALVLSMLFQNTEGSIDRNEEPRGFVE